LQLAERYFLFPANFQKMARLSHHYLRLLIAGARHFIWREATNESQAVATRDGRKHRRDPPPTATNILSNTKHENR
jgi:hypothetical protein